MIFSNFYFELSLFLPPRELTIHHDIQSIIETLSNQVAALYILHFYSVGGHAIYPPNQIPLVSFETCERNKAILDMSKSYFNAIKKSNNNTTGTATNPK